MVVHYLNLCGYTAAVLRLIFITNLFRKRRAVFLEDLHFFSVVKSPGLFSKEAIVSLEQKLDLDHVGKLS